jgi:hypothetical protein
MARGIQEKRLQEVKQYQKLLTDLEQWLVTVKATLSIDVQPSSLQAIKDQLVAYEVGILKHDSVMLITKSVNYYMLIIFPGF